MLCAIIATVLSIVAFVPYNWMNLAGGIKPNISSWLVWTSITFLNFTNIREVTGEKEKKSWVKSLMPMVDFWLCIITVICTIRTGSLKALNQVDQVCLLLGTSAAIVWRIYKSPQFAQVLVQGALIIGGIPTIVGLWHDSSKEPWISWFLWTVGFVFQFYAVKLTWKKRIEFLYPVGMVIFHALIFILAVR